MSTYAEIINPVVDTAVSLIESAEHVAVKAATTLRDTVKDRLPDFEPPAALGTRVDLVDLVNVTFDAAERLLEAQRGAYLGVVKAMRPAPASAPKAAA
jgi:hypothetical protein